jgi:hypothetical protein
VSKRAARAAIGRVDPRAPGRARQPWLLLAHQLPANPSNLRVKTWRRLQDLGAIAIKQAVYALPDSPASREDCEWLRVEIEGLGGEAVVFSANHLDADSEAALIEEFRRHRQGLYSDLSTELQRLLTKAGRRGDAQPRDVSRLRQRFQAIERIDFFGSAGRDRVASLLAALDAKRSSGPRSAQAADHHATFRGRLWVTRPRPGVDRMSSAWLIRRFIDPKASFAFVTDAKAAPADAVPFDMYGAGFGHEGDRCTFETLLLTFDINDRAAARLSEVVHDLDLKDRKFAAPEAATLGAAIDGLQLSCPDDDQLLEQGIILFEAIYRSFSQQARAPRPRVVVKPRPSRKRS